MNGRIYVIGVGTSLAIVCSGVTSAQTCSHVRGSWHDNYSAILDLSQSGSTVNGYVSISPYGPCFYPPVWAVIGTMSNGSFSITAYNMEPSELCAGSFTYDGTIHSPGCNVASGGWTNDAGLWGTFTMSKSCEIPPSETTSLGSWSGSHHVFTAVVSNTYNGDLAGRHIRETDYSPGYDSCWYPGSPIPKFEGVTQPNPFALSSNNAYIDTIGWGPTAIDHYRNHGDAPCGTTIYQQMQIGCGGWPVSAPTYHGYQNNTLVAEIGVTTLTTSRGGVQAGPVAY